MAKMLLWKSNVFRPQIRYLKVPGIEYRIQENCRVSGIESADNITSNYGSVTNLPAERCRCWMFSRIICDNWIKGRSSICSYFNLSKSDETIAVCINYSVQCQHYSSRKIIKFFNSETFDSTRYPIRCGGPNNRESGNIE